MICSRCGNQMRFLMGGTYFCEQCQIWSDEPELIMKVREFRLYFKHI